MIDSLIFSQQNSFAALEVGKHLYWQFGNLAVHAQVLIVSWIVMGVVIVAAIIGSSTAKADPHCVLRKNPAAALDTAPCAEKG